jgi:periplasmic protein TonB
MFSRLVASARHQSPFRRPAVIAGSIAAHAALLAAVVWASSPGEADAAVDRSELEEVTYIDITELPPPPDMVFEAPPPDAPPPVAAAPAAPRPAPAPPARSNTRPAQPRPAAPTAPTPANPSVPAGFQELSVPPAVVGIPAADMNIPPVRAEDFGGRGQAGGTAGGTPAEGAGGTGRIGTGATTGGTAGGTGTPGGTGDGPPTGTFSPNLVDRQAALRNQSDVVRILERLYPRVLRETGTEGSVRVQFVVTAEGRVDMSTVQVVATTHAEFSEATLKALSELRFTPARKGPHNVRMLMTLPIQWRLQRD